MRIFLSCLMQTWNLCDTAPGNVNAATIPSAVLFNCSMSCNQKKGNKLLSQLGWKLQGPPPRVRCNGCYVSKPLRNERGLGTRLMSLEVEVSHKMSLTHFTLCKYEA